MAVRRHPLCPFEVALPRAARAIWLLDGIDVQHNECDLLPIRAVSFGIEKSKIGREMFLVVGGQAVGLRNEVSNRRIKRNGAFRHVRFCPILGRVDLVPMGNIGIAPIWKQ